jgi:tRNA threonylcarbamoyladenosine biosynthesis protein TsaB
MLLALDTSTGTSSLALYNGEAVLAELTWYTQDSTAQVLSMVQECLTLLKRGPADLTGIAVALGPGSFNGLRVGLALGKGLALALQLPIVGIPTPEIVAYPFSALVLPVCAVLKAGRGRVVSTLFQTRYGRWQRVGEMRNLSLAELCQEIERTTVFCGEVDAEMSETIHECLGQRALVASPALSTRRAGYLAEMAWKRLQEEPQGDDLAALQPIYLTRPRIGAAPPDAEPEEEP